MYATKIRLRKNLASEIFYRQKYPDLWYHAFELEYYYQVHLPSSLKKSLSFIIFEIHWLFEFLSLLTTGWGFSIYTREREREREMTTLYPTTTWTNTFREERDFLVVDPWILALDE